MNFGSFLGGAADGYRKQKEEQRKKEAADREKKTQDRQDKEWAKQDEYDAARAAIKDPQALYDEQHAAWLQAAKEAEAGAAADAAIAAATIQENPTGAKPPVAGITANDFVPSIPMAPVGRNGIAPTKPSALAGNPPQTFAADHAQRQEAAAAEFQPQAMRQAANGIGGISGEQAMREAIAKPETKPLPEKPREPGVGDQLDYLTRMAAVDLKYGKLTGQGMMQLVQAKKQLTEEGTRDALLQMHAGNIEDAIQEFNQYGKQRIKLVGSRQVVTDLGGGVTMPTYEVTVETQDGKRQTINAAQMLNGFRKMDTQIGNAIEMMKFAETKRHNQASEEDSRAYHQGIVGARANGGKLTMAQTRTNEMIDAAREYIAGMDQAEIQRRTAQYSTTGKENPAYDPLLSAKWKLANQLKYGEEAPAQGAAQPTPGQNPAQPAGGASAQKPAAQSAPQKITAGAVVDGYRFKGGDPKDPAAWEAQ